MKKILIVGLSVGILFGCASNSNPKVSVIGDMGDISIVPNSIKSGHGLNGLLTAQATLQNSASKSVTGFYRCKFTTLNGIQVGEDQVWQQVTIYPKGNQNVQCSATEKEAADFTLEFSANGNNVNAFQ